MNNIALKIRVALLVVLAVMSSLYAADRGKVSVIATTTENVTGMHTEERQAQSWWNRAYVRVASMGFWAKEKLYGTRLFAGYHSTPEEKAAANEKIRELLLEKDAMNDKLQDFQLSYEEKKDVRARIVAIDKEVHEQKIITGQEWTKARRAVVGTGLSVLGLGVLSGYLKEPRLQEVLQSMSINQVTEDISKSINPIGGKPVYTQGMYFHVFDLGGGPVDAQYALFAYDKTGIKQFFRYVSGKELRLLYVPAQMHCELRMYSSLKPYDTVLLAIFGGNVNMLTEAGDFILKK